MTRAPLQNHNYNNKDRKNERGNILFIILIAIVLIGALTAAISSSDNSQNAGIDSETLVIRASEIQRYASELERGITYIMQNGTSEEDIRFAVPTSVFQGFTASADYPSDYGAYTDASVQMFAPSGGGANYREPPKGTQVAGSEAPWEFYGGTRIPGVGTDRADLIAVLPNVTAQFCEKLNALNNQTLTPAEQGGGNIHGDGGRFGSGGTPATFDDASPNELNPATFSTTPALQACVTEGTNFHFYHVILPR